MMNYLKKGLRRTISAIKKHKFLFLGLFLLQIIFLAALGGVIYHYQLKIIEGVQGIIEPLQETEVDPEKWPQGQLFGPEIIRVYQSYQALVKNITHFFLWLVGLFLIVNGAIWIISHQLLGRLKKWPARARSRLKFTAAALVIMGPLLLASYYFIRGIIGIEMEMEPFVSVVKIIGYLLLAGYYLLLVSFAFIHLDSWKLFARKLFKAALVEIHLTVPVLAINSALIFGSLYLIYYLLTYYQNFVLVMLATVLLVLIVVLTRLFWISCLEEIS